MNKTEILSPTEQKIITAAIPLFAENGYDGTSIRDICNKAGVNLSLISYYFGGKEVLYKKIVESIVGRIISHMQESINVLEMSEILEQMDRNSKISVFLELLGCMIDYFYSDKLSTHELMILFKEQITSGESINAMGYLMFKKMLASILEKEENDKEVIFKCLTIIGQIHSARILTQFSLKMMGQDEYSKDDIILFKKIVFENTKAILLGVKTGVA